MAPPEMSALTPYSLRDVRVLRPSPPPPGKIFPTCANWAQIRWSTYHSERFEDVARDVDAVLDLVGGDTQRAFVPGPEARRQTDLGRLTTRPGSCQ